MEQRADNLNQFQFLLYQQVMPFVVDHIPDSSKTNPEISSTKLLFGLTFFVAMCPDAPYFIILLCLRPDNFTCQGESSAT